MASAQSLLTAEEFGAIPNDGKLAELVRGKIVAMDFPCSQHGRVCSTAAFILGRFVEQHETGRVVGLSGIITTRDPDTVRGADVAYYSYRRFRGPLPWGYLEVLPDIVIDVRSTQDGWTEVLTKVSEYLRAGVLVVSVLDCELDNAHVFRPTEAPLLLTEDEELVLPELHADFRVSVRKFFE